MSQPSLTPLGLCLLLPQVLDGIVFFTFAIDMIVAFHTGYHTKDGLFEYRWKQIACHYLRTWFIVDFASTAPVDLLVEIAVGSSAWAGFRGLRLIRGLRLARLLKVLRMFTMRKRFAAANQPWYDDNTHSPLLHPAT